MIPKCKYKSPIKVGIWGGIEGLNRCPNIPIMIVHRDQPSTTWRKNQTKLKPRGDLIFCTFPHSFEDLCSYHKYVVDKTKGGKET